MGVEKTDFYLDPIGLETLQTRSILSADKVKTAQNRQKFCSYRRRTNIKFKVVEPNLREEVKVEKEAMIG